jgi:ABC-2 type transport system ATP-binding protein
MENTPTITTNDLWFYFGERAALQGVSLSVNPGEIFALLGPNGAGKTTTIRLLNGLYHATQGKIYVLGKDPRQEGSAVRQQTGVLTESNALYDRLTARQNLIFFGNLYLMDLQELDHRTNEMLTFFDLQSRAEVKVGTFSKGMKQRLALARAMLTRPKVLFLDEPTSSLDPESTQQVHELIQSIRDQDGHTVFLCTHRLEEAERLADRVAVMNSGEVLATGSLEALSRANQSGLRVEIEFLNDPVPSIKLNLRGVTSHSVTGQIMQLQVQEESVIPFVIEELVRQKAQILSVRPVKTSLEEVYFQLQESARRGTK